MNIKQFMNYLCAEEVTDQWIDDNIKDIKKVIGYAWVTFLHIPQAIKYLNKHVNSYEYSNFSIHEKVIFLQYIIRQQGIQPWQLRFEYPQFNNRSQMKKDYWKEYGSHDIDSFYALQQLGILGIQKQEKKPQKLSKEDISKIKEVLEAEEQEQKKNDKYILTELTQEIIDQEELSIFDVRINENQNIISYTFINKENKKVIYEEPFSFEFYFHSSQNILDKDYFVDKNDQNMYKYNIIDVKQYKNLRYGITEAFKNELNF